MNKSICARSYACMNKSIRPLVWEGTVNLSLSLTHTPQDPFGISRRQTNTYKRTRSCTRTHHHTHAPLSHVLSHHRAPLGPRGEPHVHQVDREFLERRQARCSRMPWPGCAQELQGRFRQVHCRGQEYDG